MFNQTPTKKQKKFVKLIVGIIQHGPKVKNDPSINDFFAAHQDKRHYTDEA